MKDIKTVDGKLQSAMETSFVAKDSEGPKFAQPSYTAPKVDVTSVNITFDEPVEFTSLATAAQFYLNGTNVTADVAHVTPVTTGKPTAKELSTVTVTLNSELDAKDNIFEVVGLQDLSGNTTSPNRITTKIKVEEASVVAPKVVGVEQVHDAAFRVIFDKPVDDSKGKITIKNLVGDGVDKTYAIKTAGTATEASGDTKVDTTYTAPKGTTNTAYLVTFDDTLTTDEVYNGASSIIRTIIVEDYAVGSKTGTKYTKAHSFKKDNIAPTLVSAKINIADKKLINFKFEDNPFNGAVKVNTDLSTVKEIVLKLVEDGITHNVKVDPDGTFAAHDTDANTFVLTLANSGDQAVLFSNGELKNGIVAILPYGIVTDDKADTTPQYNGPFSFIGATIQVVGGSSAVVPQTSQADINFDATLNTITVEFHGEDIDAKTVTNKANYTFDGSALPNGTTIEYGADKIAHIKLPANSVVRNGNYSLTIKNVATKSGAKMLPTTVTVYNVADNTQPVMTSAKVTSNNTVEVTFDETLDVTAGNTVANSERNFKVVINGVELSVATVKAQSTRTLVLTTTDTFDYTKSVQVKLANDASGDMFIEDVAGNKAAVKTVTATKDIQ